VYVPEEARRAVDAFFQRGHLVALREIALNIVARKMDTELLNYRRARAIGVPWPAAERLMVCLGATTSAPSSFARRTVWPKTATPSGSPCTSPCQSWAAVGVRQAYLAEALNLAERFGAQTVTLSGPDVVPTLLQFARENNVSQIVVGRPRQTTLLGTLRGYPVYRLLRKQSEFDLVLVAPTLAKQRTGQPIQRRRTNVRGYVTALFVLGVASGLNLLIEPYANPTSLYAIYLLSTLVIALSFGLGPSIWTAILSFLTFDFLFIAPKYALAIKHATDLVGAVVFLATSIAVGQLIQVSRRQSAALRMRANRSSLLEDMTRDLLVAATTAGRESQRGSVEREREATLDEIARTTIRYIGQAAANPSFSSGRLEGDSSSGHRQTPAWS